MAEASLTSLEMTAIGAVSGTVEVCIMQPTVGVKNAIQEGRPIPRNPAGLYRGLLVRLPVRRAYKGQAVRDNTKAFCGAHRAFCVAAGSHCIKYSMLLCIMA